MKKIKDKSLTPGIFLSLSIIFTTIFAYTSDIIIFWVALLSLVYGFIKIIENYSDEKLSN